jgi:uncharacterized protein (DUF2147 family)
MPNLRHVRILLLSLLFLLCKITSWAQIDPIEHEWFNEEKTAKIQIYKAVDGKYYGKIIWLKEPLKDGKPKVDFRNPDANKKNNPVIGLCILKGFNKENTNEYSNGTIYDPKNGKTYSCIINHKGNKLDVRGYYGISLIGRSTIWTLAE